jgi:hypothetical protein
MRQIFMSILIFLAIMMVVAIGLFLEQPCYGRLTRVTSWKKTPPFSRAITATQV